MNVPRKIQLTGRNTYIVSLPHDWVARVGVKKGDALYMEEGDGGGLVLSLRESKKDLKSISIDVSQNSDLTMRNVVSAYVGGAGRIVLRGVGTNTIAEEARRVLSGVEIAEEDGRELTMRILDFEDLDIDSVMKRAYNVTLNMFDLSEKFFRSGDDALNEIARKEDEVDRLYLLMLRNVAIGRRLRKETVFKVIAAKSIEKVSDHIEDLCMHGRGHAPNDLIAGLLGKSARMYSVAYQSLSQAALDQGEFSSARSAYLSDYDKVDSILKKEKNPSRMLALRGLAEKCNKVLRYSEDIMESSSDLAFTMMDSG